MRHWLGEGDEGSESEAAGELEERVHGLLGEPDSTKERLVRRLIDRLLLRFEERAEGWEQETELEEQIDRTDICHSSFPRNLELVLSGIGKLRPETDFSGCGSVDGETVVELRSRFEALCKWIGGDLAPRAGVPVERSPTRVWLAACLAKTIKEQCGLEGGVPAPTCGTSDLLE